jgi:DNA-binding Xre family transcriptional regulator
MQLNLKKLRKARSLTQAQLAKLCDDWVKEYGGLTESCNTRKIQKLEQDYFQLLDRDLVDALCSVLNCNIDDLIKITRLTP